MRDDSASQAPRSGGQVRRLAGHLLELLRVRLEIFGLEAQEEAVRWAMRLLLGWAAVQLLCFGLLFAALTAAVVWWDEHRLLALGCAAAVFLLGGLGLGAWAAALWRSGPAAFPVTRAELEADRRWLAGDGRNNA
ncbi:MAG TPA: phage holin family protein [Burkholderiaceae bacterium]|nr:phage holin family protein [Burkholderiaceae bacterium]